MAGLINLLVIIIKVNVTVTKTMIERILILIMMMRKCRPELPLATACLTVGNVRKIHMRSDTCPDNHDDDDDHDDIDDDYTDHDDYDCMQYAVQIDLSPLFFLFNIVT